MSPWNSWAAVTNSLTWTHVLLFVVVFLWTPPHFWALAVRYRDDYEAARWYRAAAEQGNPNAENNLGVLYESGRGVPRDKREALRWFRAAAAKGHPGAKEALRQMGY